ncbi:hypothetical protein G9272_32000 [Streptomyces asoensis]|uniref:Uncharacterized protein n=1 Tax=Streptomyces asoensis TaxID=249586 RepID=A0A6M4WWL9_9ACTN|nr:hypothetical protein [Streptomyces asoensis]QJT04342.1 hypothetical protein G9272_32000 [Streptomyces asoensis]
MLGRRGAFLLILGIGKTCWGIGMLVDPPSTAGLYLLTQWCDIRHWAWLWISAGIITTVSAFLRIGRDRVGFVVALIPPIVWAIAYMAAVVSGQFSRGAYVALWYLTSHVGVILWAATVPEYSVPPAPQSAREGGPG